MIKAVEMIRAEGHKNISARHKSTLEITREAYLTPRGDCIIGIKADKSPRDFSPDFKENLRKRESVLEIILYSEGEWDVVKARGSEKLVLGDDTRIIVRKSGYIDPATIAIHADKAARDLNRKLVEKLSRGAVLTAVFIIRL